MQVDNMTMRSFPVIFGPRKAFNHQESKDLFIKILGIYRKVIGHDNLEVTDAYVSPETD